jgi:Co/Zn/Cd efflux system component
LVRQSSAVLFSLSLLQLCIGALEFVCHLSVARPSSVRFSYGFGRLGLLLRFTIVVASAFALVADAVPRLTHAGAVGEANVRGVAILLSLGDLHALLQLQLRAVLKLIRRSSAGIETSAAGSMGVGSAAAIGGAYLIDFFGMYFTDAIAEAVIGSTLAAVVTPAARELIEGLAMGHGREDLRKIAVGMRGVWDGGEEAGVLTIAVETTGKAPDLERSLGGLRGMKIKDATVEVV